jgi:hypothetical protein
MITVAQLIEYLRTLPQDAPVAYRLYSEQCLLELGQIDTPQLCIARPDGWVQNARPDEPSITYVVFQGN